MGSKRKKQAVDEDENEEEYEVEAIRDKRVHRRGIDYLVKWKGYAECTWVKEIDLSCDDLVATFEAKRTTAPSKAHKKAKVTATSLRAHEGQGDRDVEESKSDASSPNKFLLDAAPTGLRALERDADLPTSGDADDEVAATDAGLEGDGWTPPVRATPEPEYDYGIEDEYEPPPVETILDKRLTNNSVEYLAKRMGVEEPDWESASSLHSDELLEQFERVLREASAPQLTGSATDGADRPRAPGKRKAKPKQSCADTTAPPPAPRQKKTRVTPPRPSGNSSTRADGLERTYLGKYVAFSPAYDKWLKGPNYDGVGTAFIVGRISDYRYMKKQGLYEIRWLESMFQKQVEKIPIATVKQGFQNYEKLKAQTSVPRWLQLCRTDPEDAVDIGDDIDQLVEHQEFHTEKHAPTSLADVEKIQSMRFEPEETMRAPTALYSHADGTTVTRLKSEYVDLFEHSASSSFFAYLPVYFWRQVLEHTNEQAKANKVAVPFTLDELMKFLGIIWYMALVQKGEYANYWGEQVEDAIFTTTRSSLDTIMSLRRFKQLRSAFCFRNARTITPDELKLDAAVRIRSLLNLLKQTGSKYVDVGRDLAVDEASVAARSKFARHLIVFNPKKPTGKYHFKLYMTCCATSWIALSYRLHCESTIEQRATGVHEDTHTELLASEMSITSKTRQIVLEITRQFHGSGRIVNCDNYYTSVQLLEALRIKHLFCRGTVKQVSKHFPRHVVLPDPNKKDKDANKSKQKRARSDGIDGSDSEQDEETPDTRPVGQEQTPRVGGEVKRGDYLQAVCKDAKILAASWCDGNIVTIISNADASTVSTVERKIHGEKCSVPAPTAIKEYNKYMQGVDRNDQLRARFSVADGHSFKKWHKKLAFAIIDVARVNAYLTRRMCTKDTRPERDSHRSFVTDLIKEMLHGKWQDAMGDEAMLYEGGGNSLTPRSTARSPQQSPATQSTRSPSLGTPTDFSDVCTDMTSAQVFKGKRRKRICIVCRFEGRVDTTITMACLKHNVSLCKRTYPKDAREYGCLRSEWSCWEKYHEYYMLQGTFSDTGCVVRSSKDYKEKSAFVEHAAITREQLVQRSLSFDPVSAPFDPAEVTWTCADAPATSASPAAPTSSSTPATPFAPSTPGSFVSDTLSHDYV